MLWLTDALTKNKIAINPKYVVAVFVTTEDTTQAPIGKTVISLTNGTIIVDENDLDVVGRITSGDNV